MPSATRHAPRRQPHKLVRPARSDAEEQTPKVESQSASRAARLGMAIASRWPYALVFVVAVVLRSLACTALNEQPLWRTPQLDSLEYLLWATRIASGDHTWPVYAGHSPGYPYALGVLLAVSGGELALARLFQGLMGALSCVLTASVAGRLFGPRAVLPAGLLQAFYGPLVVYDTAILAEGPFLFVLAVALNVAASRVSSVWRGSAVGACIGVAALLRPTGLVLWPAWIALAFARERGRDAWRYATTCTVATALVLAPAALANWRASGSPMLQGFGGMNFYLGNSPAGTGLPTARPGNGWDDLEGMAGRAGISDPASADRFYLRKTLAEISERPLAFARLISDKAAWLVQSEEVRDTHSLRFLQSAVPWLTWLPGFGVVLALASVGMVEALRRRLRCGEIWLYLCAFGLSCLLFVIGSRYRLPLVPALIALGGAGLAWLSVLVRERQWRRGLVLMAIGAVILAASHVRTHAASRDFSEEWVFTALSLSHEGDPAGSVAACERAIALSPRNSFAWDVLGLRQLAIGETAAALSSFRSAVDSDPGNASAWLHLGNALERTGKREESVAAYRRSLAIAPERTDAIQALGQVLVVFGEFREAGSLLRKVLQRDPGVASAHAGLALIALAEGDGDGAVKEARLAASLRPGAARMWLLLARAAVLQGNVALAEEAMTRAEQTGAGQVETTAGRLRLSLLRGDRDAVASWLRDTERVDPERSRAVWAELQSWPPPR